ncbi:MAG: hypothetical protein JXR31_07690 [Prolixibacteraceae bacterium]|nr:hypothetical protein [Prolixibacteraceae bacterium]MBN2774114.1 hypothetical protein [Prolixibacteraceae bacterium]
MTINYKLDKSFGKAFSIQGLILIAFGFIGITSIWPVLFIILGTLLFFSYSGVEINTETHKLRFYHKLFGIFKTGKWDSINKYHGLTIVPYKKFSRIFSRSNRSVTIEESDFRIFLVNKNNKPEFPIKKCKSVDDAQDRIDELSLWLKLPVFTIKH